jgi:hypothetical protein
VLDAYFANARGSSSSAVVLRVYGGLSREYEIVSDPHVSTHTIFRYTPGKSIWGDASDGLYTGKHSPLADYEARATKVPVTKNSADVPEAMLLDLMVRAKAIDTSICERLPLKDSKAQEHLIEDAPWLEIIVDGGRSRTAVTDTSGFEYIISQNPVLLQWALDLQKVSKVR